MAQEVREFAVLVPAGTVKSSPLVADVSFPVRRVLALSWRVPPGPSGVMGWALTSAGAPVIPIQPGAWIVTDNESATWSLEGFLDSGNWQLTAYNEGSFDHTVYLTFLLDLISGGASETVTTPASGTSAVGTSGTVITSGSGGTASTTGAAGTPGTTTAVVTAVTALLIAQAAGIPG